MSLNLSTSTASRPSWRDPSSILLPIFLGALRAAPFAPFFAMFLGEDFGLSGGRPAPSAWALAVIGAIGFWSVHLLPRLIRNVVALNVAFVMLGLACWYAWMALEPHWDVPANPITIANTELIWTFLIAIVFWILTLRLALDEREQSSEGVRGIMVRSMVAVLAGTLIAGFVDGDMGRDGVRASFVALPVVLVAGVGAVGMSEMAATRAIARRRGTTVPGWNRWVRSFAGTATILLLVTFVAALVLGPGFIEMVVDALALIWRGIATAIIWVLYGIIYVFVYIYRGVAWLLGLIFDAELPEVALPEQGQQGTPPATEMPEQGEVEPWWFAPYLRFAGLIALVLVGLALLVRFARFRMAGEVTDNEEERSSVFSGSLLKQQIRNLFQRRSGGERPRKLDLGSDPASVRESMLYLQALAARLGTPRRPSETPHDFTGRLSREWASLDGPLREINRRYERVRYGETEDDRAAVVAAWREIWAAHRDEPGAQ
jgi:hypothetical protein